MPKDDYAGSILDDVKKIMGFYPEYTDFDDILIIHINSTFATLHQLGVGPVVEPYQITSRSNVWDEFTNRKELANVKSYVWAKVRLMFDPPSTSFAIDALKGVIAESEFRLNVAGERIQDESVVH